MRNYFMYENKRRNKFVIEYPKLFATDRHWIMHTFHNNKFQICILVSPRSKIFFIISLKFLLNQIMCKVLQELKKANQALLS